MYVPVDAERLGLGRCRATGPKFEWDKEASRWTTTQVVERGSGLLVWQGVFVVMGGEIRVDWAAKDLDVEPESTVGFTLPGLIEGKAAKNYWTATRVELAD